MTSIPHDPSGVVEEKRHWSAQLLVPEMWACLAIIMMWLAVLVDAVVGPDILSDHCRGR